MKIYEYYNPNPKGNITNDCVIRALSKALNIKWEFAKALVDAYSYQFAQSEDSDMVWFAILADRGFRMEPYYCKERKCDLIDFVFAHPVGTYVVKLPNHVVCVKDGTIYDTWNSSTQTPLYYWVEIDE